ncbi:neuraminidase-like domain-containing protein [Sorangium sp. So ce119]|uniref:Tc toxin subunit A-related protein n=1 Tax=Sorangium sp. So ce119 TaxID=3133279 RepID=UPI003F5F2FA1
MAPRPISRSSTRRDRQTADRACPRAHEENDMSEVKEQPAAGRRRITGRVREADGTIPEGVTVAAFAKRLRRADEPLGEPVHLDAEGRYTVAYTTERPRLDVYVAVSLGKKTVASSAVVLNAGDDETIDVAIGGAVRPRSDFERTRDALGAVLTEEGLELHAIGELDFSEVALLSARSGVVPRELVLVRQSFALARETGVPAEVLYALGRQKIPLSAAGLLASDPAARRDAVARAVAENQVEPAVAKTAVKALAELDELGITQALRTPRPGESTLGGYFDAAGVAARARRELVDVYREAGGATESFWRDVRRKEVLDEATVDRLQLTLQLAAFTHNHLPLVTALLEHKIRRLADLAAYEAKDWLQLIVEHKIGVPPDLAAAGMSPQAYASMLEDIVEEALPTAFVAHRAQRLVPEVPLAAFYAANPAFDMRSTPIAAYVSAHPQALAALGGAEAQARGLRALKAIERTYRVAPSGARSDVMAALLREGVDSAFKIRSMGRATFLQRFSKSLGSGTAVRVYAKASNAAATATMLLARYGQAFEGARMAVMPARPESIDAFPEYRALFGSLDSCSCEHCQSVYSPAAYLVDVLRWLDLRPSTTAGKTALDVLFDGRRADLGAIELSCDNTLTSLPYIDLVNEILELTVAPVNPAPAYQTTGKTADLLVHPEHLHVEAYEVLAGTRAAIGKDAIFPFQLPFNLWLEEARVYLGQLGLPRHRLMADLHAAGPTGALVDAVVATEVLGMSPLEWDIVAGKALVPARTPAAFWGMAGDAAWVTKLASVALILDKATPALAEAPLEFEALVDLLRGSFVQGGVAVGVWFDGTSCDVAEAKLVGLTVGHLDRLHRFIRLARQLSIGAADLDLAIDVLGSGVLDEAFLVKLAAVRRLHAEHGTPLRELLAWWGPLDTRRWKPRMRAGRPTGIPAAATGLGLVFDDTLAPVAGSAERESLYDSLFQSRATAKDPDPAFRIAADGDALLDETQGLVDHAAAVSGALGITGQELARLVPLLSDDRLTLANLSALYRHASLARAIGASIDELVSYLALTGIDPFDPARPAEALRFIDEAKSVRGSGFSPAELDYVLRHVDTHQSSLAPDVQTVGALLIDMRDGLRKIDADLSDAPAAATRSELRERLSKQIASVVTPEAAETLFPGSAAAVATTIAAVVAAVDVDAGAPPAGTAAIIDAVFPPFLDPVAAKASLADPLDPTWLSSPVARLRYVLDALTRFLRESAKDSVVVEKVGSALGLAPAIAAPVLKTYVLDPGPGGTPARQIFRAAAVTDYAATEPDGETPRLPSATDLPAQFRLYERLHKVALVLARFGIGAAELAWLFERAPARGILDLAALPTSPPAPGSVAYAPLARLRDVVALRNRAAGGKLVDLFVAAEAVGGGTASAVAAAHEALLAELPKRTHWDPADIEYLVGVPARGATPAVPSALGLVYPDDWRDEQGLLRVARAVAAARRIGLAVSTWFGWRLVPATIAEQRAQADAIKNAVRGRYEESLWREVARPLRDGLRDLQRQALASWLIAFDARFPDAYRLYAHTLLDVAMSPCQLTSRLRQAMSSAQLFVQRALMNLEPRVVLSQDDSDEWKWMKNYRVWEANRKVFLYPENWIEPELRDDKSPFYSQLEQDLLQADITADTSEAAAIGYLERLDEVARLHVVGSHHQVDGDTDLLHVFARTPSTPPLYFYRQRVDGARWTPWERVDVEIEGEHLLPFIYNRRLYIFWAQITEAAVETVPATPQGGGDQVEGRPIRYYQIRLAWSERKNGRFQKRKLSTQQIGATDADYQRLSCALRKSDHSTRGDFFFRAYDDAAQGDLLIEPIRFVRSSGKKSASHYERLDRFRMSGSNGAVTLERQSSQPAIVMRLPAATEVYMQSYARADGGGTLMLPGRNPLDGAIENQPTLDRTPLPFQVVPAAMVDFASDDAFFFQDRKRTFFVEPRDAITWYRDPPEWTIPDRTPLDPGFLIPELWPLPFPTVGPDPWIYDPAAVVTDPTPIDFVNTAPVVSTGGTRVGGLLAVGAAGVLEALGGNVASIGSETVATRSSKVMIRSSARLVDGTGTSMLSLRSGAPPSALETTALRSLTSEATYEVPALEALAPSYETFVRRWDGKRYRFDPFFHPYVDVAMRQLNRFGIDGLWNPSPTGPEPLLRRQVLAHEYFEAAYEPRPIVTAPYPRDKFDFSYGGAYASYNWELFFHVPFAVAVGLSKNRQFEDAQAWFHYLFDPTVSTNEPAPQRFWKIRPFYELYHGEDVAAGPIHDLLLLLHYSGSDPEKLAARDSLLAQIAEWRRDPFNPHAIARLRPSAYQKAVVMRYLDNLIEWGDDLFRRDTLESLNEATQLYAMAAQILGPRPREVSVEPPSPRTFNQLRALGLDAFSNALVEEIEGHLPEVTDADGDAPNDDIPVLGPTTFFCIPPNDRLLTDYWDRVGDRLFKLRHCMNIEGVVRQLPLFEPPIDPAMLVRAAAAGIDLASALSDLGAPLPYQRYEALVQKATELCADVRAHGQALLAALEKRDAEALGLLRAGHETKLQDAMVRVRERQVQEAKESLESIVRSKENAELRATYFRTRAFMSPTEILNQTKLALARGKEAEANDLEHTAAIVGALPDISIGVAGFGGSPTFNVTYGSQQIMQIFRALAVGKRGDAAGFTFEAQSAQALAHYQRRADDWANQAQAASKEAESLEKQRLAAEIRVGVAEHELENLKLQIEHAKEAEDFLRSKYTSDQLYKWMVGQLSTLYFQSYKLAYDLAKRAERAWQFELGVTDRSFIQFGYWDGLKKGLLSGERLHYDLKRMEVAYLDAQRREYELTRHVSIRELDPLALVDLRRDGECIVDLPEVLFDMDSPGHYMRRIKTVAVSIPSVTGPYVPVRCTLTLLASSVRATAESGGGYARSGPSDPRFRDDLVGVQSIVTSKAQEDSGLFEANLQDPCYLPFEGAGAISTWRLELPRTFRQFDYDTISDVVLHVRYTAREGGSALGEAATGQLAAATHHVVLRSQAGKVSGEREGLMHLLSARQDFGDEWHRFLHPPVAQADQTLSLALTPGVFPFYTRGRTIQIAGVELFLVVHDPALYRSGNAVRLRLQGPGGGAPRDITLPSIADAFDGLPHGVSNYGPAGAGVGTWTLRFSEADNGAVADGIIASVNGHTRLLPASVSDLIVLVRYNTGA